MGILATNVLITSFLSLALLISIALFIHFSTKNISTPKPFAYTILKNLYIAAFLLIIPANSPKVVSYTQPMTYVPTFLQFLLTYLEVFSHWHNLSNLQAYFLSDAVAGSISWWIEMWQNVAIGCPFWWHPSLVMWSSFLMGTPSLANCKPRRKSDSLFH